MTTVFSALLTSITSVLQQAPAVSAVVDRIRLRPISAQSPTAVVVRVLSSEVQRGVGVGMYQLWQSRVELECYARATPGTPPDQALDPLLQAAYARLMSDPSLAGTVGDINPLGVTFSFDADGDTTACATLHFNVQHVSAAASLTP